MMRANACGAALPAPEIDLADGSIPEDSPSRLECAHLIAESGQHSSTGAPRASHSVLLASLQRVCRTGVASTLLPPGPPGGANGTAADPLTTVFDVTDFDPLPFDEPLLLAAAGAAPAIGQSLPTKELPAADRRKLPRRESDCLVAIRPCAPHERPAPDRSGWLLHSAKLKGIVLDVSMSGAAFQLPESIVAGTRVVLRMSNKTVDKCVDTAGTILRCRQIGDCWSVVCQFDRNLTFEQIHVIGRNLFAKTIV